MIRYRDLIVPHDLSIKKAMRIIDRVGTRIVFVVDADKKLIGAVSDSEIRKAILYGRSIEDPIKDIRNPDPVVLREAEANNQFLVEAKIRELLKLMPDSRFLLVLDREGRPCDLIFCQLPKISTLLSSRKTEGKHVLVVGGAGYLGSVLTRRLLDQGFKVRVLDLLLFGIDPLKEAFGHDGFSLVQGDMRNITTLAQALRGIDAVVNLAAIVGDPACRNQPETTIETNYLANKALAEACRYHQINRFLYASTCSVYGVMHRQRALDEKSDLNPVSLYARSKIQSEEAILSLVDQNFSPTIMRMGTLYGLSPRMRFDLVVNTMAKTATTQGRIMVHGGGKQWRPLLHIDDAAQAYVRGLTAPIDQIRGQIFNVGSVEQNYQILKIAEIVRRRIPTAKLIMDGQTMDARTYFVSFVKIQRLLKFKAHNSIFSSVGKIHAALRQKKITDPNHPKYYNSPE